MNITFSNQKLLIRAIKDDIFRFDLFRNEFVVNSLHFKDFIILCYNYWKELVIKASMTTTKSDK